MKRNYLFGIFTFLFAVSICNARVFVGGGGGGGSEGESERGGGGRHSERAPGPPVVIKMQHHSIPRPQVIHNPSHVWRERRSINFPERDEHGAAIQQRVSVVPPQHHVAVLHNTVVVRDIQHTQRVEVLPNHYYWHDVSGLRYCH